MSAASDAWEEELLLLLLLLLLSLLLLLFNPAPVSPPAVTLEAVTPNPAAAAPATAASVASSPASFRADRSADRSAAAARRNNLQRLCIHWASRLCWCSHAVT